ncbi:MAG: hypothetical protein JSV68_02605 [Anaerolineaceae bacterium]|nr:MAG: hypothetical protein JSV68_02605 [Anaerolineaceae bacterium]
MNHCSAKVASGAPCCAWAIRDSDPPLCSAHSGLLGGRPGNTNAVTHGYYQKKFSAAEIESLFDDAAENVTLRQETALIRVVLRRLSHDLLNEEPSIDQIKSVARLIFAGTRALFYVQPQVTEKDSEKDWDETYDQLAA